MPHASAKQNFNAEPVIEKGLVSPSTVEFISKYLICTLKSSNTFAKNIICIYSILKCGYFSDSF